MDEELTKVTVTASTLYIPEEEVLRVTAGNVNVEVEEVSTKLMVIANYLPEGDVT